MDTISIAALPPVVKALTFGVDQTLYDNIASIGEGIAIDIELPAIHGMGGILVEDMDNVHALPEVLLRNRSPHS